MNILVWEDIWVYIIGMVFHHEVMILVMTDIGRKHIVFQEMINAKELIQRGKCMKYLAIDYDYIHVCATSN